MSNIFDINAKFTPVGFSDAKARRLEAEIAAQKPKTLSVEEFATGDHVVFDMAVRPARGCGDDAALKHWMWHEFCAVSNYAEQASDRLNERRFWPVPVYDGTFVEQPEGTSTTGRFYSARLTNPNEWITRTATSAEAITAAPAVSEWDGSHSIEMCKAAQDAGLDVESNRRCHVNTEWVRATWNFGAAGHLAYRIAGADRDGWFEWKGGACPVKAGTRVEVNLRGGGGQDDFDIEYHDAAQLDWAFDNARGDILKFRVLPKNDK